MVVCHHPGKSVQHMMRQIHGDDTSGYSLPAHHTHGLRTLFFRECVCGRVGFFKYKFVGIIPIIATIQCFQIEQLCMERCIRVLVVSGP